MSGAGLRRASGETEKSRNAERRPLPSAMVCPSSRNSLSFQLLTSGFSIGSLFEGADYTFTVLTGTLYRSLPPSLPVGMTMLRFRPNK